MDNKRTERTKAVIDLHDYLETLGSDRPPVGVFLKELGITPETMSDCVSNVAMCSHICEPAYAVEITNYLFKLGVTIGYKYAVKKEMDRQFGCESPEEKED
jgi:hypothetical protein